MFEEALRDLVDDFIDGRVTVVESFEDAPDREPDEYHWFSVLDGAGAAGLQKEDVTHSYTMHDIPSRQGVIAITVWNRPGTNAYFVHGTIGTKLHKEYDEGT